MWKTVYDLEIERNGEFRKDILLGFVDMKKAFEIMRSMEFGEAEVKMRNIRTFWSGMCFESHVFHYSD